MSRNSAKIIKISEDSYGLFYDWDNCTELGKRLGGKLLGYKCNSVGEVVIVEGKPKGITITRTQNLEIVGFID